MKRDKAALRATLAAAPHKVDFTLDPYQLTHSQRSALHDTARSVGYRKSVSSCLSLGAAFFVYLAKDLPANKAQENQEATPAPAARWDNHNIARS